MNERISLVIVDDEEYVIFGLQNHIDWNSLNIDVVGTASNGQDGISEVLHTNPDIVLVDIEMPIMDGITMMKKLVELGINTQFIIFSWHNDFLYAKSAIEHGVIDYILKPSLPEELELVINKTAQKCRMRKSLVKEQKRIEEFFIKYKPVFYNDFIEELLFGHPTNNLKIAKKNEFLGINIENKDYCVITIHLDKWDNTIEQLTIEQEQYILYMVSCYAAKELEVEKTYRGFRERFAHFLVVREKGEIDIDALRCITKEIVKYCRETYSLLLSVGISSMVPAIEGIQNACKQGMDCLKYNFENTQIVVCDDLSLKTTGIEIDQYYNKAAFAEALRIGDVELIIKSVHDSMSAIKNNQNKRYLMPLLFDMLGSTALTLLHMGYNFENETIMGLTSNELTINELEERLIEFYSNLMQELREHFYKNNSKIVKHVINYVKENYNKNVTLNEIADEIYFTPNYLSSLFSKSTGENFSMYLTQYRIKKAIEFLDSGRYKVYEVANMVGYKNTDYFCKVFREITGVVPSCYKK